MANDAHQKSQMLTDCSHTNHHLNRWYEITEIRKAWKNNTIYIRHFGDRSNERFNARAITLKHSFKRLLNRNSWLEIEINNSLMMWVSVWIFFVHLCYLVFFLQCQSFLWYVRVFWMNGKKSDSKRIAMVECFSKTKK